MAALCLVVVGAGNSPSEGSRTIRLPSTPPLAGPGNTRLEPSLPDATRSASMRCAHRFGDGVDPSFKSLSLFMYGAKQREVNCAHKHTLCVRTDTVFDLCNPPTRQSNAGVQHGHSNVQRGSRASLKRSAIDQRHRKRAEGDAACAIEPDGAGWLKAGLGATTRDDFSDRTVGCGIHTRVGQMRVDPTRPHPPS